MVSPDAEHANVALRDGRVVTLAPLRAADDAEVALLLDMLSDPRASFFARAVAARTADAVHGELAAYAAWQGEDGGRRGEFAGAVDPRFAELGLGTLLLRRSARDALEAGLETLRVELYPGSAATASMLRDSGLRTHWDLDYPVVHVDLLLGTQRPGWVTP